MSIFYFPYIRICMSEELLLLIENGVEWNWKTTEKSFCFNIDDRCFNHDMIIIIKDNVCEKLEKLMNSFVMKMKIKMEER